MLTKLTVSNFKRFREVDVEFGRMAVLVGPNDSGKTTILRFGAREWSVGTSGETGLVLPQSAGVIWLHCQYRT